MAQPPQSPKHGSNRRPQVFTEAYHGHLADLHLLLHGLLLLKLLLLGTLLCLALLLGLVWLALFGH